jgi:hypothetical protein
MDRAGALMMPILLANAACRRTLCGIDVKCWRLKIPRPGAIMTARLKGGALERIRSDTFPPA